MDKQAFYPEDNKDKCTSIGSHTLSTPTDQYGIPALYSEYYLDSYYGSGDARILSTVDPMPAQTATFKRANATSYTITSQAFTGNHPPKPH